MQVWTKPARVSAAKINAAKIIVALTNALRVGIYLKIAQPKFKLIT